MIIKIFPSLTSFPVQNSLMELPSRLLSHILFQFSRCISVDLSSVYALPSPVRSFSLMEVQSEVSHKHLYSKHTPPSVHLSFCCSINDCLYYIRFNYLILSNPDRASTPPHCYFLTYNIH